MSYETMCRIMAELVELAELAGLAEGTFYRGQATGLQAAIRMLQEELLPTCRTSH